MKTLLFMAMSLLTFSARADILREFSHIVDDEINRLKAVNMRSLRYSDANAPKSCRDRYKSIYNKRAIRIVYAFGYGDAGNDHVLDHYSYTALRSRLLRPCQPDIYLCGFRADKNDKDLLRKAEQDSTGENNYLIELKLVKGSLSGNDRFNTLPENSAAQKAVCESATRTFLSEVASGADFVVYNGHSRDGGGPDFCPPVRKRDHHVNYSWYQKNRPGLNGLATAMKTAVDNGNANKVVGLFSCSSQKHFLNRLMSVNNKAGYVVTGRLATFDEMMRDSYAALDSLIAQRCEDGFRQSFDSRGAAHFKNMFISK